VLRDNKVLKHFKVEYADKLLSTEEVFDYLNSAILLLPELLDEAELFHGMWLRPEGNDPGNDLLTFVLLRPFPDVRVLFDRISNATFVVALYKFSN